MRHTQETLALHRLFRRMQQRNRFVAQANTGELSLSETILLLELDADTRRKAKDLTALLRLDKSTVSYLVKKLSARGLIKASPDAGDRRAVALSVTAAGRRLLARFDRVADAILEENTANLSPREAHELIHLLRVLADGYGEPPGVPRAGEHPVRAEQRRLARCFGLLDVHFMDTDLPSTHWHVLAEICQGPETTAARLAQQLHVAPNTISEIIARLEKAGLLAREKSSRDLRSMRISPTPAGKQLLARIEERAAEQIAQALPGLPVAELRRFRHLLERFLGVAPARIGANLVVEEVRDPEKRNAARSFLLRHVVRLGFEQHAPAVIVPEDSLCYVILRRGRTVAAADLNISGGLPAVTCCAWDKNIRAQKILPAFLSTIAALQQVRAAGVAFQPLAELLGAGVVKSRRTACRSVV